MLYIDTISNNMTIVYKGGTKGKKMKKGTLTLKTYDTKINELNYCMFICFII